MDINKEQFFEKIPSIKKIKQEIKSNPNNWIVIKKWNYKIFNKYKISLFNEIDVVFLNEIFPIICKEHIEQINNFVDIKHIIEDAAAD